jgi:hypothetical protein
MSLTLTTKTSPQGIKIEYVDPTSGVQATPAELGRYRKLVALVREKASGTTSLPRPTTKPESYDDANLL